MEMQKIYTFNYEVEAISFVEVLRANDIPHEVRKANDSSYPGIFEAVRGWGDLYVLTQDKMRAMKLLKDHFENVSFPAYENENLDNKPKATKKPWLIHIFYIVLLCIAGMYSYTLVKRVNKLEEGFHPIYRYEWDKGGEFMNEYKRSSNALVATYYDQNRDYNFERQIVYTSDRSSYSILHDTNENGCIERIETYTSQGICYELDFDRNENRLLDSLVTILQNGTTLVEVDSDQNNRVDSFILLDKVGTTVNRKSIDEVADWLASSPD